ncbi:hypothetical protein CEXT_615381 [Caerostris extrusa]|uniref:Uncharacterized protein n=1 Tax=Caerostris extrusa TaxID=172846 RepID=A0AAV4W559_CAEEX|nr:hypothetical protein CEXT_615381 [Caerostris extrusa]
MPVSSNQTSYNPHTCSNPDAPWNFTIHRSTSLPLPSSSSILSPEEKYSNNTPPQDRRWMDGRRLFFSLSYSNSACLFV